jgi:ParB-like chromosome segregation protein Spo0J
LIVQSPANPAIEVAVHPAAEIFPLMGEADLQELAADIKAHGQREPVAFYRDQLLDGRNRWLACRLAGVDPETCEIDDDDSFDPEAYVISVNAHRRHLTPEQRSYCRGDDYLRAKRGHGGDRKSSAQNAHLIFPTAEQVAAKHGVNQATIRRDAEFAAAVDEIGDNVGTAAKAEILAGKAKSGLNKSDVIEVAQAEPEKMSAALAAKKAAKSATKPPAAKPPSPGPTTDELGATLPGKMRPAFDMRDIFTSILSDLRGIKKRVDALATSAAGVYLSDKELAGELDNVIRALKYGKPYAICPQCKGKG